MVPRTNDFRHRLNASFIYELPAMAAARASSTVFWVAGSFPASFRRDRGRADRHATIGNRQQPARCRSRRRSRDRGLEGHLRRQWLQLSQYSGLRQGPRSAATSATIRPGNYMPGDGARSRRVQHAHDVRQELLSRRRHKAAGSSRHIQRIEQEELQQSPNKHEQRGLRPDHRRRARAGVSVRSALYFLTHHWKIGRLEDW